MSGEVDCQAVLSLLVSACETRSAPLPTVSTVVYAPAKQRFTFVCSPPHDLYSLLDVAKVTEIRMQCHPGFGTVQLSHSPKGGQVRMWYNEAFSPGGRHCDVCV